MKILDEKNNNIIQNEKSKDKPINYFEILEKAKEDSKDK